MTFGFYELRVLCTNFAGPLRVYKNRVGMYWMATCACDCKPRSNFEHRVCSVVKSFSVHFTLDNTQKTKVQLIQSIRQKRSVLASTVGGTHGLMRILSHHFVALLCMKHWITGLYQQQSISVGVALGWEQNSGEAPHCVACKYSLNSIEQGK